jgi:hypothetical protein
MNALNNTDVRRIRICSWAGAAGLSFLPLIVIKAVDANAWEIADLPFALIMVAAVAIAFEIALRIPPNWTFRAGTAAALATAFLLVWGNLAVGFAGSEDNRINIIFFAVPLIALIGSIMARFRSAGIAVALTSAAAAQIAAGMMALLGGHFTIPLTVAFTGFWLAAALLFRRAAREMGNVPA